MATRHCVLLGDLRGGCGLDLTTVDDRNHLGGGPTAGADGFHLADNIVAIDNLAKDDVLAVEPVSSGSADEELRSVSVGSCIRHRQRSRAEVHAGTTAEALIGETVPVNGLTASAITTGEVTTLAHELRDHTVERRILEPERLARSADTLVANTQGTEVLRGLRNDIGEQLHGDSARGLTADGDVEVRLGIRGVDRVEGDLLHSANRESKHWLGELQTTQASVRRGTQRRQWFLGITLNSSADAELIGSPLNDGDIDLVSKRWPALIGDGLVP